MPTAVIVHGFMGSPNNDWMRWTAEKFHDKGYRVFTPKMPRIPSKSDWVKRVGNFAKPTRGKLVLVGHSLGGVAILRFLETYKGKVDLVMLVSTPTWRDSVIFRSFFRRGFQWKTIRKHVKKVVVVHSTDDPVVKFENTEELRAKLKAKVIVAENLGHMHSIWDKSVLNKMEKEIDKV